jgi:hypothetical protein
MARYRILHWKDIPSLVEATDGERTVQHQLSQRFQDLIDAVAMRLGAAGSEAYLEGWERGPETERPGGPERVVAEVAAELESGFEALLARLMRGPG